jgi:hypothetical protein
MFGLTWPDERMKAEAGIEFLQWAALTEKFTVFEKKYFFTGYATENADPGTDC